MSVLQSPAASRWIRRRPRRAPPGAAGRPSLFVLVFVLAPAIGATPLTVGELDRLALAGEAGTEALEARARAARERAVADAQLPDPMVSIGALNLPVDTFAVDQERMTQLRLGVRQQFPGRGTLAARGAEGEARAEGLSAAAELRRRQVLRQARMAWLTLLWRLEERALLDAERPRLEALERTVLAGYGEGAGSQQDVLRARLELDALDERLLRNAEAVDVARADLARWIADVATAAVPVAPPQGSVLAPGAHLAIDPVAARERLRSHPALAVREARIDEAQAGIGLAEADYRPDWGVEVGYGLRDDLTPTGDPPDLLSATVSVELPLFPRQRQDRRLAAARADREATRAEHVDALRSLERDRRAQVARGERLEARRALHAETIAPRAERTSRAALEAYRADAGDFPEVMRAVLAGLDVRLTLARLDHEARRVAAELDYLLASDPSATGPGNAGSRNAAPRAED